MRERGTDPGRSLPPAALALGSGLTAVAAGAVAARFSPGLDGPGQRPLAFVLAALAFGAGAGLAGARYRRLPARKTAR